MKKIISVITVISILLSVFATVFVSAETLVNTRPSPKVYPTKGQHPRLLITSDDIEKIRENFTKPQNQSAYKEWELEAKSDENGILPVPKVISAGNIDGHVLSRIEAKAFDYVVNGNKDNGYAAINAVKNIHSSMLFPTTSDYSRSMGMVIYTTSVVYDWCYDIMTDSERKEFIANCLSIASQMETGWPPEHGGTIIGHGCEAMFLKNLLSFAIAVYDEDPSIYEYIGARLYAEYVPFRNYYYKSQSYHQGSGYSAVRCVFDFWSLWIMYKMSGEKIYTDDFQYMPYMFIYYTRPDEQIMREGDYSTETIGNIPAANSYNYRNSFFASGFYKDPYLKAEMTRMSPDYSHFEYDFIWITPTVFLIINDPDVEPEPYNELPTTKYMGSPNGNMVARTGWNMGVDSNDAIAMMKIGEEWMANHHHLDFGTFQIYYKGSLANDSGIYDSYNTLQDANWDKETISHNGLLIYDPSEYTGTVVNSGGQKRTYYAYDYWDDLKNNGDYKFGKVTGYEYGPDLYRPEYSYISGDITGAYTDKVSEVRRSMLFEKGNDSDTPAFFFVMDKITSKKDKFKKTFLLHSLQEPEIEGNVTTIKRDTDGYNGKLTVQTLYPTDASIEKIGGPGKQWLIDGINYVPNKGSAEAMNNTMAYGWGRVEISPKEKAKTDYFLNVMYVSDADKDIPLKKAETVETDDFLGAKIDNKLALFAKDSKKFEDSIRFKYSGEENSDIFISGLSKGLWSISLNGVEIEKQAVSESGGVLYFKGGAGKYFIKHLNNTDEKKLTSSEIEDNDYVYVKIGKDYLQSEVYPVIENGTTLVPLRAISEKFESEVSYDEKTNTATVKRNGKTIELTENSDVAYLNGEPIDLGAYARVIKDRFMVPLRFLSESFGCKVSFDDLSKVVSVSSPEGITTTGKKKLPAKAVSWSSESATDKNGTMALDGDAETRWAANGIGENLIIKFDKPEKIVSFSTMFGDGIFRGYNFELYASEDGDNWNIIYKGSSSAKKSIDYYTLKEPVTAQYIKYVGKGGTYTDWILLHEIEFYDE